MTFGFLGIGFVYTNNMSLLLRPDVFAAWYRDSGRGLHLNAGDPTAWPRYMHFVLGAASVAGLAVAWLGVAKLRTNLDFGRWAVRWGSGWCAVATLLNFIAGLWWLGTVPRPLLLEFFSGASVASVSLGVGIATGLVVLVLGYKQCRFICRSTIRPVSWCFAVYSSSTVARCKNRWLLSLYIRKNFRTL